MIDTPPCSPDSGFGRLSPLESELVSESDQKQGKKKKLLNLSLTDGMFADPPSGVSICPIRNSSLFTDFALIKKTYWNSGEKNSSRSEKRQKTTKRFDNDARRKSYTRKRKPGKDSAMDTDDTSPVLGIRILPADQFKESNNKEGPKDQNSTLDSNRSKFVCKLCFQPHEGALSLATHKCARIVNESYICPDCDKAFSNPANLASHRRWHKPKDELANINHASQDDAFKTNKAFQVIQSSNVTPEKILFSDLREIMSEDSGTSTSQHHSDFSHGKKSFQKAIFPCPNCKRRFRRNCNRRKHIQAKHRDKKILGGNQTKSPSLNSLTSEQSVRLVAPEIHVTQSTENLQSHKAQNPTPLQSNAIPAFQPIYISERSNVLSATLQQAFPSVTDIVSPPSLLLATNSSSSNLEQTQPLDLSVKTTAKDKLTHSIDEIMKKEREKSELQNLKYPFQPIRLAYPSETLYCPQNTMRFTNFSMPRINGVQNPFAFHSSNPFLTQIHWTYGTSSQSSVSSSSFMQQKRE